MGRPLFSKAFQTEPLVREPEPPFQYQKWSYVNPFDPDSDEFFENDQAVYEAIVDRIPVEHLEDNDEVDDRDMVVIRMGNTSPIPSEDTLSDRDSPMAVGADDPAQYIADAYRRQRVEAETPVRVRLATRGIPAEVQRDTPISQQSVAMNPSPDGLSISDTSAQPVQAQIASLSVRIEPADESLLPSPSAPIPVPGSRAQRSASVEGFAHPSLYYQNSPMTPPARHTSFARFSPSPPPTISPRIYTWASRRPTYSPTGTSPFTNTNARLSHTHLSPVLARALDVMT